MIKEINSLIKKIIKSLIGMSTPDQTICWYKTLWFNFIAFGFKGIVACPVLIYHNTKIYSVGKIDIQCPIKRGLISIGHFDLKSQGKTKFNNHGEIIIHGFVEIGGCTIIENFGTIVFKGYNRIADGCLIVVRERLEMGEQTRLGFHSMVMDSDDHYTIDVTTKKVFRNTKPIIIGAHNWIASNTFIKKGVKTPDYTIVASANALLTKDYSDIPPYSVLGGAPVKLLKTGIRRIYNRAEELRLTHFFEENPNIKTYEYTGSVDIEKIADQEDNKF